MQSNPSNLEKFVSSILRANRKYPDKQLIRISLNIWDFSPNNKKNEETLKLSKNTFICLKSTKTYP